MRLNPIFSSLPTTVFELMSGLARQHDAINLGQGFPDGNEPQDLIKSATRALKDRSNQYAPSRGMPELRDAAARFYSQYGQQALRADNIVVTSGATEGICAALMACITNGDEVIIIEPAYDAYRPLIERAGGVVRAVQLQPPLWRLDRALLEQAVGPKTRAIVFNNPMNPTGRAFDSEEVEAVASLCRDHDLIAISDEVWECLVFDGRKHIPLAHCEGMAKRTLKIGSAGKLFGLTGWKIGFVQGQGELLEAAAKAHQFITFSSAPHLQLAIAQALNDAGDRFERQTIELAQSRDHLDDALKAEGLVTLKAEATYFLCIDLWASGLSMNASEFAHQAVIQHRVAGIPVSAFMSSGHGDHVLRLCFAKPDTVLTLAAKRLGQAVRAYRG